MKNNIALFFTGCGIGVFLGLSKSPILLQILVPILTIVVGLLAILTGQKGGSEENKEETNLSIMKNINVFPIMWMILGMVSGSIPGMLARNYDILSPKQVQIEKSGELEAEKLEVDEPKTVLFGVSEETCKKYHLCDIEGIDLICVLKDVENPEIEEMLSANQINLDSIKNQINRTCNCKN